MVNLNPQQFFHGSLTPGIDEVRPAGSRERTLYEETDPNYAYFARGEADAWRWAELGRKHDQRDPVPTHQALRVYEVEPTSPIEPDTNFFDIDDANAPLVRSRGPARVTRELQGPMGSQFRIPGLKNPYGEDYANPLHMDYERERSQLKEESRALEAQFDDHASMEREHPTLFPVERLGTLGRMRASRDYALNRIDRGVS